MISNYMYDAKLNLKNSDERILVFEEGWMTTYLTESD